MAGCAAKPSLGLLRKGSKVGRRAPQAVLSAVLHAEVSEKDVQLGVAFYLLACRTVSATEQRTTVPSAWIWPHTIVWPITHESCRSQLCSAIVPALITLIGRKEASKISNLAAKLCLSLAKDATLAAEFKGQVGRLTPELRSTLEGGLRTAVRRPRPCLLACAAALSRGALCADGERVADDDPAGKPLRAKHAAQDLDAGDRAEDGFRLVRGASRAPSLCLPTRRVLVRHTNARSLDLRAVLHTAPRPSISRCGGLSGLTVSDRVELVLPGPEASTWR